MATKIFATPLEIRSPGSRGSRGPFRPKDKYFFNVEIRTRRRKGEITRYANERDFPHLAELEPLPPCHVRTWLGLLLPRRTYTPLWPTERRTPAIAEGLPVLRREHAMSQKSAVSAAAQPRIDYLPGNVAQACWLVHLRELRRLEPYANRSHATTNRVSDSATRILKISDQRLARN
jgi:hypothetical protein